MRLYEALLKHGRLVVRDTEVQLTAAGTTFFEGFGIDLETITRARRPTCRRCLDWSVRRHHLAGALGAAVLQRVLTRRWVRRHPSSRVVALTPSGTANFEKAFRIA